MDTRDALDSLAHIDECARAQLRLLFDWNPRTLTFDETEASEPTQCHESAFYNKHLAPHLQLRLVQVSPSISQMLLHRVDAALRSADSKGISLNVRNIDDLNEARASDEHQGELVVNEASLVELYGTTTAKFASEAASMLLLHPEATTRWSKILEWRINRPDSPYAPPSGHLAIKKWVRGIPMTEAIESPSLIPEKYAVYRDIIQNLADKESVLRVIKHLQVLALWRFKSLAFAPENAMRSIFHLQRFNQDGFPWQTCRSEVGTCSIHRTVYDQIGPDIDYLTASLENVPTIDQLPASRTPSSRAGKSGDAEPAGSSAKVAGSDICEKYIDSEEGRAIHWVQQTWCEAVKHDATVVVFHSGNHEVIGLRHRQSQTLLISDIIKPPTQKEYGKLEIGLYIMAIEDALNRAKILDERRKFDEEQEATGGEGGSNKRDQRGDDEDGHDEDNDDIRPRKRARSGRDGRGKSVSQEVRSTNTGTQHGRPSGGHIDKVLQLVGSRDVAAVFLRYGIYDTVSLACFARTHPSLYACTAQSTPPPPPDKSTYRPDEHVTLALISEYKDCATGAVHDAVLEVRTDDGECWTRNVIAKLAFERDQQARLANEYQAYQRLASKSIQEVPLILGMYRDLEDSGPTALVMTHEGTHAVSMAFIQALQKIHAAGVLHNDIRHRNLLISDAGEVTIIDFDCARWNPSAADKVREVAELKEVLGEL
ncbi:hypothetical protein BOTBODRAFT_147512 [Botryobasidium botryosum FD-172 SS1]|uniref:Protein kinase domain-containing protein n=1 Tax=Botryobasidium botryosum (strain FD-172 SS1) TaxID=930990 RepID=A0A067MH81_BOTB1|nr:hypothetical protein BOTBODRAFT_147512 [Botryobasidium botryosum FD-172 SS1]